MPEPVIDCIICGLPLEPGVIHEHHELDTPCRYTRSDYLRDQLLLEMARLFKNIYRSNVHLEAAIRDFSAFLPETPPDD